MHSDVNQNFKCKVLDHLRYKKDHLESLFLEINIKSTKHVYGVIYRRPGSDVEAFLSDLDEIVKTPEIRACRSTIMGDFNLDLLTNSQITNDLANLLYSYNFTVRTTRPTRVSSRAATLIDHIWSNCSDLDQIYGILMNDQSDHFSPFLTSSIETHAVPVTIKTRNYNFTTKETLLRSLERNLSNYQGEGDVDTTCNNLIYALQNVMDECYPYRTIKVKPKSLKNPWITDEIKILIKQRNKLLDKYCNRPITYGDSYRALRNRVNHIIHSRKREYYNNEFHSVQGDQRGTWKKLSKLLNKNSKSSLIIDELNVNGDIIIDQQNICNNLNNYFANAGRYEDSGEAPNVHFSDYLDGNYPDLTFSLVSVDEISNIIKTMNDSGPGPDDVSIKLIKEGSDILAPIITKLVNNCLTTGNYPRSMKVAKIVPVFKGGERNKPDNYRQISILCSLNKIIEKVIYNQLLQHAENNHILVPEQFGFRKGKSTSDAILHFLKNIHDNNNQFKYTAALMIDLAKAFDSVNLEILVEKLKFYGVTGIPLKLLRNYLTDRKQYTFVNGLKSPLISTSRGVPQGSILGPLLFLYFINDFVKSSNSLLFSIFADDTCGLISSNCINELRRIIIDELINVNKWLKANQITANIKKTHFIIFCGRLKNNFSIRITFNNKTIAQKPVTKMLGVLIDENLNWSEHIMYVNKKVSKVNGILYKLSKFLNSNTLKTIYNSLIYPHLQYGNLAWGNAAAKYINKLFISQKRAIRNICHAGYLDHTNNLFKNNMLLKINEIHCLECVKFVKKELSKPNSEFFSIRENNHGMALRNELQMHVNLPQPRSELSRKFITYSGANIWNDLPHHLKIIRNPATFKINVKKHYLNSY